jgi:hypothetical protein
LTDPTSLFGAGDVGFDLLLDDLAWFLAGWADFASESSSSFPQEY